MRKQFNTSVTRHNGHSKAVAVPVKVGTRKTDQHTEEARQRIRRSLSACHQQAHTDQ